MTSRGISWARIGSTCTDAKFLNSRFGVVNQVLGIHTKGVAMNPAPRDWAWLMDSVVLIAGLA
jgi:hypothetical protein